MKASIVIWITVLTVSVIDVILYNRYGSGGTISNAIINTSYEWPIVPCVFGIFIGHFFFSMGYLEYKKLSEAVTKHREKNKFPTENDLDLYSIFDSIPKL